MAKSPLHRKTVSARISTHKIADGIYLLRFKTQYELTSTFLRVQEYYESPRFQGRIFTLEQFMDWYAAQYGSFSYFEDWSGFNVPSTAFQPFFDGKFDPLTHELAHALFFTDAAYREAVHEAMRGYDTSALEKKLVEAGYARHVVPDEVQAYIVAPSGELGAVSRPLEPLRRRLRALFKLHSKGLSIPTFR
jgi:hypothetical protein